MYILIGILQGSFVFLLEGSHNTSGKAGGLKNVNRSKRLKTMIHLKVDFIQTVSVDQTCDLHFPVSLCIL